MSRVVCHGTSGEGRQCGQRTRSSWCVLLCFDSVVTGITFRITCHLGQSPLIPTARRVRCDTGMKRKTTPPFQTGTGEVCRVAYRFVEVPDFHHVGDIYVHLGGVAKMLARSQLLRSGCTYGISFSIALLQERPQQLRVAVTRRTVWCTAPPAGP